MKTPIAISVSTVFQVFTAQLIFCKYTPKKTWYMKWVRRCILTKKNLQQVTCLLAKDTTSCSSRKSWFWQRRLRCHSVIFCQFPWNLKVSGLEPITFEQWYKCYMKAISCREQDLNMQKIWREHQRYTLYPLGHISKRFLLDFEVSGFILDSRYSMPHIH